MSFQQANPMVSASLVEYSSDLGVADTWHSVGVSAASGMVEGVGFTVTPGSATSDVSVSIPASKAMGGSLYSRLRASQN